MSLWCGSCRKEIFEGFGLLFKLERDGDGRLLYPDKEKDYAPPNAAVCDPCWATFPQEERHTGEEAKASAEESTDTVFIYTPASSDNDPFWKSKTWSGIQEDLSHITFVSPEAVMDHLTRTLPIIKDMEQERALRRMHTN